MVKPSIVCGRFGLDGHRVPNKPVKLHPRVGGDLHAAGMGNTRQRNTGVLLLGHLERTVRQDFGVTAAA